MMRIIPKFLTAWACLVGARATLGFDFAYNVSYFAVATLAVTIAGTFLWLWYRRDTPLALGMAASWTGCAGVMGSWLVARIAHLDLTGPLSVMLFGFMALYLVGALTHVAIIVETTALPDRLFWVVVVPIFVVAVAMGALP